MEQFRIDPEFRDKIPPIGEDEFKQLRENILAAGEVYEPLVVWNGILLDGHNRWKVIRESTSIKYRIREMSFPDKWAAFEWMYKNQLGRRNLTDEQRAYTIGKMYEARKKSWGRKSEKQHDEKGRFVQSPQNDDFGKGPGATAHAVANEIGISKSKVERSEKFSKGIDTLREINPEAADKVLSGRAKVTKTAIAEIPRMEEGEAKQMADSIINGQTIKRATKEDRQNRARANEIIDSMKSNAERAYTLDMLVEDIQINSVAYFDALNAILDRHGELIDAASKPMICEAIQKYIIDAANELRRKIR